MISVLQCLKLCRCTAVQQNRQLNQHTCLCACYLRKLQY